MRRRLRRRSACENVLATTLVGLSRERTSSFSPAISDSWRLSHCARQPGARSSTPAWPNRTRFGGRGNGPPGISALGSTDIAPFLYARAFEQVRNDVCFHKLPVFSRRQWRRLCYGVMGATHHALQTTRPAGSAPPQGLRPGLRCRRSLGAERIARAGAPAYFPSRPMTRRPRASCCRPMRPGAGFLSAAVNLGHCRSVGRWHSRRGDGKARRIRPCCGCLSRTAAAARRDPRGLDEDIQRSGHLVVVEEHVAQGGAGQALAHALLLRGTHPSAFPHRHALGYPRDSMAAELPPEGMRT